MTIISSVWVLIRGSYGGQLHAGCTKKNSRAKARRHWPNMREWQLEIDAARGDGWH
jgi:hypothetical protein